MTRIALQGTLLFAILVLGSQFALADDSQPNANNSTEIAQNDAMKNCAFVTNNCELCSIDGTGKILCSSVGIACQPTNWSCLSYGTVPNQ